MIPYGFTREVDSDFDQAVGAVGSALESHGFGVLTRIDVQATLKQKLGVDMGRYVILGACNPASAHRAIEVERDIGLMLPCNVIVYERDDRVIVSAIRPAVAMGMIDNKRLKDIAAEVEAKIERVIDSLQ